MELQETEGEQELYYLQDRTRGVDNSMLWCTENGDHTCDLKKAKVLTKQEMEETCKSNGFLRAWSKKYIDERIQHHIDMYDVDFKHAIRLDD